MMRVALRNLWEHKLRTALLALAVVAGVGFVTAAYVFTDSLSAAFSDAFSAVAEGVDISVQPVERPGAGSGSAFPRIDGGLVELVRGVDGVEAATPVLQGIITLVTDDDVADDPFGPPTFGISWSESGYFAIVDGGAPAGPDELVVDSGTAEQLGLSLGDRLEVAGSGRAQPFVVVGTFGFPDGGSALGAPFVGFTFETARSLLGVGDQVNGIEVALAGGADLTSVLEKLNQLLPSDAEALDSQAAAEAQAAALQEGIGFFNTFLLVFGAIALIVGAFVVYNAFRVVIAQRSHELALLRVLGSRRRQLVLSVLGEALAVGTVASGVGLLAGLGLAVGIRWALSLTGTDLPDSGLVLEPRTIAVAFGVGLATTLLSALAPAVRTARISPMEALRDQPELKRIRRWWLWVGLLLLAGAVALVLVGAQAAYDEAAITGNTDPLVLIGIGCLGAFIAVFLLARVLVGPVLRALGSGARSSAAVLGRENARRSPRRTAVTASALMIGLGLVATVAVLSRSVEDTILAVVEDAFTAEIVVQAGGFDPTAGVPVEVADVVGGVEGVAGVARLNAIELNLPDGESTLAVGVEPDTVELAIGFDEVEGDFADLGPDGVAVQRIEAESRGWRLGDELEVEAAGAARTVAIRVLFTLRGGVSDSQSFYLDYDEVRSLQAQPRDISLAVGLAEGADVENMAERLSDTLSDFPGVAVNTVADLLDQVRSGLAAVVGMVAGLLLMSVAVALMGIVLTLYLAVFERTRETGLLRAVGMSRQQVRAMIRSESVLIALFGTLLGLGLGLFCGWALSVGVVGQGVRFGVPWLWVTAGLVGALLAGVLAAVIPARRAARMDVLAAIAYE